METIGAYEAKTHLPQLLKQVSKGQRFTITKHGVPVATLQSPKKNKTRLASEIITDLRKFRIKHQLKGLSIHDMINEGRR